MVAIMTLPTFLTSQLMNSDRCLFNAQTWIPPFYERVYRFMTDLFKETIISLLRTLQNSP